MFNEDTAGAGWCRPRHCAISSIGAVPGREHMHHEIEPIRAPSPPAVGPDASVCPGSRPRRQIGSVMWPMVWTHRPVSGPRSVPEGDRRAQKALLRVATTVRSASPRGRYAGQATRSGSNHSKPSPSTSSISSAPWSSATAASAGRTGSRTKAATITRAAMANRAAAPKVTSRPCTMATEPPDPAVSCARPVPPISHGVGPTPTPGRRAANSRRPPGGRACRLLR